MDRAVSELLNGEVAEWFPLLPRPRPPCRALPQRIDEIRELTSSASRGAWGARITSAAEAHNKAALVLSDCGLEGLAKGLCWRQFDIFYAAAQLDPRTSKLALQPVVNIGRLLIRSGEGTGAYRIFQSSYDAVTTRADTTIEGRHIDFGRLTNQDAQHQELRKFLWTVLLADGTRALTRAGRWEEAYKKIKQHKGIGKRLLDGRQVAILARCAADQSDAAVGLLNESLADETWEQAVAVCLRALCDSVSGKPIGAAVGAMVTHYLELAPTPGHPLFRARLGLCVLILARRADDSGALDVAARIVEEAVKSADAYIAWDVLSNISDHECMTRSDRQTLIDIVDSSGLRRGAMPEHLLQELMAAVTTSEEQLTRLLAGTQ